MKEKLIIIQNSNSSILDTFASNLSKVEAVDVFTPSDGKGNIGVDQNSTGVKVVVLDDKTTMDTRWQDFSLTKDCITTADVIYWNWCCGNLMEAEASERYLCSITNTSSIPANFDEFKILYGNRSQNKLAKLIRYLPKFKSDLKNVLGVFKKN